MPENATPKKNAGSGHKPASSSSPPGAPKKQRAGPDNYIEHKASRDSSPSAPISTGSQRKDKK
ncbi:hypothetical protein ACHAQE_004787 [Botrytis cinerea]